MRFIHIADVHLGAEPEAGTAYSKRRPDELWETFSEVVSLCEQEQTDLLLIAGDLFHRQPLLREDVYKRQDIGRISPYSLTLRRKEGKRK